MRICSCASVGCFSADRRQAALFPYCVYFGISEVYNCVDRQCLVLISDFQKSFGEEIVPMSLFRDPQFQLPPVARKGSGDCMSSRAQVAFCHRVIATLRTQKDAKNLDAAGLKMAYRAISDGSKGLWRSLAIQFDERRG